MGLFIGVSMNQLIDKKTGLSKLRSSFNITNKLLPIDKRRQWWDSLSGNWKEAILNALEIDINEFLMKFDLYFNVIHEQENWDFMFSELDVIPDLSLFKNIKRLELGLNKITGLPDLSYLNKLEVLVLIGNGISWQEIPDLSNLLSLKVLELGGNYKGAELYDGNILSKMSNYQKLNMSKSIKNEFDCYKIRGLFNLERLNLSQGVHSFSCIRNSDYLSFLKNLNELDISGVYFNTIPNNKGLKILLELPNLKKLKMVGCRMFYLEDSIDFLPEGLISLEELDMAFCDVKNIWNLRTYKNLKSLRLSGNPINDITPILRLDRLEYLELDGLPIKRSDLFRLRERLPSCEIRI